MGQFLNLNEAYLNRIIKKAINETISEKNGNYQKWYRGYNSKFGSDRTHLIWLTDIEEARTYGNRVEEVVIDKTKMHDIDPDDLYYDFLVPEFGYPDVDDYLEDVHWYPEKGLESEEAEKLLRKGYNCYYFNTHDADCICMWDKTPIVSRRELTKEEFEEIETYDDSLCRKYDDEYEMPQNFFNF